MKIALVSRLIYCVCKHFFSKILPINFNDRFYFRFVLCLTKNPAPKSLLCKMLEINP